MSKIRTSKIKATGIETSEIKVTEINKMTTRQRIIDEALTLFSRRGYNGTSVKNIADAVGIKDSSIYKHFRSKREIIDAIADQMRQRIEKMSLEFGLPQEPSNGAAQPAPGAASVNSSVQDYEISGAAAVAFEYGSMSLETLQELIRKVFLFYLRDDFASRFWRLAGIEQYQNKEIYEIYRTIFFEQSIQYQRELFAEMIKQGAFREADPEAMAISFYAPVFFLLSKYSDRPDETDEALRMLDRQIEEFCRVYKK